MLDRSRRSALVLSSVLLALVFAAAPAVAESNLGFNGQFGNYEFHDNADQTRGADCFYETHQETHHGNQGYWLDKLSIRGPKLFAYDNLSGTKQWVGWLYKIQTAPASNSDVWTTVYVSSATKAKVDLTHGYQFPRRTWVAPENLPNNTNYRVAVTANWYKRPNSTKVQGQIKVAYEYYHVKGGGVTNPPVIRNTDCYVAN
jgi:hypothetical protein